MAAISLSEIDKENIATFFRAEFGKIPLDPRASEKIVQCILGFCDEPVGSLTLDLDDSWPVITFQLAVIKRLIKLFFKNLTVEIQSIRRRNRMN